jgi:hypothetical protein
MVMARKWGRKIKMYFEDLHIETNSSEVKLIKIAWLEKGFSYNKRKVSEDLIRKLKEIGTKLHSKGWHTCPFCKNAKSSSQFIIPVPGKKKAFYDAPHMIIHYIEEHGYCPPQEFIDAVLNTKI